MLGTGPTRHLAGPRSTRQMTRAATWAGGVARLLRPSARRRAGPRLEDRHSAFDDYPTDESTVVAHIERGPLSRGPPSAPIATRTLLATTPLHGESRSIIADSSTPPSPMIEIRRLSTPAHSCRQQLTPRAVSSAE